MDSSCRLSRGRRSRCAAWDGDRGDGEGHGSGDHLSSGARPLTLTLSLEGEGNRRRTTNALDVVYRRSLLVVAQAIPSNRRRVASRQAITVGSVSSRISSMTRYRLHVKHAHYKYDLRPSISGPSTADVIDEHSALGRTITYRYERDTTRPLRQIWAAVPVLRCRRTYASS
jgi:hypothetical protein